MKKLLSIIVCLAMVLALGTTTFATSDVTFAPGAETPSSNGAEEAPGGAEEAPGGSEEAPGGSEEAPGGSEEAPGGSEEAPGGSEEAPGGSEEAPGGSEEGPGGSEEGPGGSEEGPGGSEEGPGGSEEGPGGSETPVVNNGTLTINGVSITVDMNKVGFDVEDPNPNDYALLVYTSAYSGKALPTDASVGGWNRYGYAFIVAKDGTITAIYDGSAGKIWSTKYPTGLKDDNVFLGKHYAETAIRERQGDEIVIIAPNGTAANANNAKTTNFVYTNVVNVCNKQKVFVEFVVSGLGLTFESEGNDTPGGSENEGNDTPGGSENEGNDTPGGSENEGNDTPGGPENEGTDTPGGSENEDSDTPNTGDGVLVFFLLMAMSAVAMVTVVCKKREI